MEQIGGRNAGFVFTPKGFDRGDPTPLGLKSVRFALPRAALRLPWALGFNPFGVKTLAMAFLLEKSEVKWKFVIFLSQIALGLNKRVKGKEISQKQK